MFFALLLSTPAAGSYGEIPELHPDSMDIYHFSLEESEAFAEHFVDAAYKQVGGTLDSGDVAMYSTQQCERLLPWLEIECARDDLPHQVKNLYINLLSFIRRAVDLKTGVVISL